MFPFRGYEFSKEDKEQLLKTGNLGKVVELADPMTGEMKKCLVSVDRLTNEIEAMPVDKIFIKKPHRQDRAFDERDRYPERRRRGTW